MPKDEIKRYMFPSLGQIYDTHAQDTRFYTYSAKERYTHTFITENDNSSATHRKWSHTVTHLHTDSPIQTGLHFVLAMHTVSHRGNSNPQSPLQGTIIHVPSLYSHNSHTHTVAPTSGHLHTQSHIQFHSYTHREGSHSHRASSDTHTHLNMDICRGQR